LRVLVIKLGALGDFIQALGPMACIRQAHPQAEITLLTTPPFEAVAHASNGFDLVDTDGRPRGWRAQVRLLRRLRRANYDRVYDLQTSKRSSTYYYALWPKRPQWSGIARGCSHPHQNPARNLMHTLERQAEQLRDAGIWDEAPVTPGAAPPPDLGWMIDHADPKSAGGIQSPFALLAPGGSAGRPDKRWSASRYAGLARSLLESGLGVGVIGGPAEPELAGSIVAEAEGALDLTATNLFDIAALAARASLCVGNDTGPTHLIASMGTPTLSLFSHASDPALCAPRGSRAAFVRRQHLDDLTLEEVLGLVEDLRRPDAKGYAAPFPSADAGTPDSAQPQSVPTDACRPGRTSRPEGRRR